MRPRTGWVLAALLAIAGIGVGYWSARSAGPSATGGGRTALSNIEPVENGRSATVEQQPFAAGPSASQSDTPVEDVAAPADPNDVARWIADTTSGDPQRRAAAIEALGRAPRSEALPVLRNVLLSGEPAVDRPLALRALRDLALYQGDADGAVRAAVREVIYHGDEEAVAYAAQEALDIVEESELR
jgi:hypothetical protein